MARSKVAVVSATPETVLEDYARALALVGFSTVLREAGKAPALLLDLRWSRFQPGAGPTPWQLDAVLRSLDAGGFDLEQIPILARRGPEVDPEIAARHYRLAGLLQERGLRIEELPARGSRRAPETRLPELEQWCAGGVETPALSEGRPLIVLSSLSTHASFALAGAVGAVASEFLELERVRESTRAELLVAEAYAFAQEVHPRIFALTDATTCGLGQGPRRVRPSNQNLILASADPVAADAVAARVLGLDPRRVPYLAACGGRDLGAIAVDGMDLVGEMPPTLEQNLHAPPAPSLSERLAVLGSSVAPSPARRCLRGVARDGFWYPIRGRGWRHRWNPTPWGRLFQEYRERSSGR